MMRIAVTYENGGIFQHFGHTEQFKLYDVENNKVVRAVVVDTNGSGHGALATFLKAFQVDKLICGGIGGGARMALASEGIALCAGVTGECDAAVEAYLCGKLSFTGEANCSCSHHHHDHGDGHTCHCHS